MVEDYSQPREALRKTWLRQLPIGLGVCALVGAGFLAHYYAPPPTSDLRQQVDQLSSEVQQLQQELVSYTHLDVYKRQGQARHLFRAL